MRRRRLREIAGSIQVLGALPGLDRSPDSGVNDRRTPATERETVAQRA